MCLPPEAVCLVKEDDLPRQKRIGLQLRVCEQRHSLARSSKQEHGSEMETGQVDANGCQGAKIRFSFCLTGGEQSLRMRMRIHVFHCTHTHTHIITTTILIITFFTIILHHHHPRREEKQKQTLREVWGELRERSKTFCFPSRDSPRWRFHPGTSLEPAGCKGSWYRGKRGGGQHSPWPWPREEAPMFPTMQHHGKSHTLPWELPGEGGDSR